MEGVRITRGKDFFGKDDLVLDAGAGSGAYSLVHKKTISIDINPKNPRVEKGDIYNTRFRDKTFDGVLLCHVIEHLEDPKKALKEIYRVLKPKGKLVIITPVYHPQLFWMDKTHREPWNPEKIARFIKKNRLGFKIISAKKRVFKRAIKNKIANPFYELLPFFKNQRRLQLLALLFVMLDLLARFPPFSRIFYMEYVIELRKI